MMITKIAIGLIGIGNIFYAYRCILGTRAFIDQYGMRDGSAFMIKRAGTFCAGLGFMLAYVLMTGIAGTWELFTNPTAQPQYPHPAQDRKSRRGNCGLVLGSG